MIKSRNPLWFMLLAASLAAPARAADTPRHGFLERTHKDADGSEARYQLFVPAGYSGEKPYPLILFLHGSGETGSDGVKQTTVGLGPAIRQREKTFPFFALFPQSQKRTWKADSDDARRALDILAEVQKEYQIDAAQIYLTGLSMGGAGTWSLAVAHSDRWAAIVPICGGGVPDDVEKIKDLPCWCFYGADDRPEGLRRADDTIAGLRRLGAKPAYFVYPDVGHNCWDRAYAAEELYSWLLRQHLKPKGDG
jgi:predicted peptidase